MLLGNDIIKLEGIDLIVSLNKVTIKSCRVIVKIYIKVRARDLLLVRPIYIKSTITILLYIIVSVSI